jgi:hypothetical protein
MEVIDELSLGDDLLLHPAGIGLRANRSGAANNSSTTGINRREYKSR